MEYCNCAASALCQAHTKRILTHHTPLVWSHLHAEQKKIGSEQRRGTALSGAQVMTSLFETTARPRPSFAELFTPKLMTVLREGYGPRQFHVDAIAGLTVAIVALPLSMAIAIASGVSPERGLYTAIIGGFLVSALGGSRFQIGGPAGAFIVLGAGIVERHGYDGLALATLMAGIVMIAAVSCDSALM